uniref:Family with sequence similarity 32 member A n=1 Tax=Varanus komodoensis TaxID=61221 RepID=A0A8D2J823_VARKO
MAEYAAVQRGPLRLKGGGGAAAAGKRKKKPGQEKHKIVEQTVSSKTQEEEAEKRGLDKRTPAQLAYEKMQEKRKIERILKKASKTHKQRVEVSGERGGASSGDGGGGGAALPLGVGLPAPQTDEGPAGGSQVWDGIDHFRSHSILWV